MRRGILLIDKVDVVRCHHLYARALCNIVDNFVHSQLLHKSLSIGIRVVRLMELHL